MIAEDVVRFAVTALLQQPRRAGLSLLGVVIGVVAVIFLTALGEGARRYVAEQFLSLGTDVIVVIPGKTETTGMMPGFTGTPNDLTLDDAEALLRRIPEAVRIAPISMGNETISYGNKSRQVVVLGSTAEFFELRGIPIARDTKLPAGDIDRGANVVVLGRQTAEQLFAEENPVGKSIRVGEWRMRVIGVNGPRGTHLGQNLDEVSIVPVATGMRMFNRTSLFRVMLQLRPGADIDEAKRKIEAVILDRHDEVDVTCVTPDSVVASLSAILATLTLVLVGIAAISLTVAGIGIMNVMLVAVSERRAEIGLLKAVGATHRQVMLIFLMESLVIATAGALLGLAAGYATIHLVTWMYPAVPAAAPLWAVACVLGLSVCAGVFFGVMPA
ncbi:MAG TPA: ABC transporter permease, partial [Myxococcota bacterium]|nr:ABC transporter permease [Myxococcota bacterium]